MARIRRCIEKILDMAEYHLALAIHNEHIAHGLAKHWKEVIKSNEKRLRELRRFDEAADVLERRAKQ